MKPLVLAAWSALYSNPVVHDASNDVTYHGLNRNGIEVFLNIPYGQDTGGENRFRPPRPYMSPRGSIINATAYGPACPQALGPWVPPISLTNITKVSEDCLNLNIARPMGKHVEGKKLPVLVYIHGGSFWAGSNEEITIRPDGMILESVRNGLPVIHVAMNYRFGFFGFARSGALKEEGSENAGLKDQRLALEWVRDNIAQFGGDPNRVTIFGQSSGGLSVGMHIMAYGGSKPAPFHQAIAESQALEPGITGNFTTNAMQALVDHVGCNKAPLDSSETIQCLRSFDTAKVLDASLATYQSDTAHNIGDIWLPSVDGDFLPAAPSQLIRERRFSNVTTMMGWCEDDVTFFTDASITTDQDTHNFLRAYVPGVSADNIGKLMGLYPASEFPADPASNASSEFYRSARIFRDIVMTCQPLGYAEQIAAAGNTVYLYHWNQTILDPFLSQVVHRPGMGVIHTSEFAYIFGNLSHYDTGDYDFCPSRSDYHLKRRGSRSWSTYASTGKPSLERHHTLQGFRPAFTQDGQVKVFVVGGPHEGLTSIDGHEALPALAQQKLRQRCAFINSPDMVQQLGY
ncbi:Carboxylesterase, type B [Metarhizium album ARSEF 1941]|uniref:Carboxylic ester hydrolase n=1 Tax=Metarhizium album (strain ARSEF 1941) TaxID=1081103 RepID=A0A0B2WPU7_METAS|nr:Carboxylesterase, type B [Metarhizium album ARSEF 1941]KHN95654.1 Carboxylesterase, type B [Metarhizium album ARSEF 1941]